MSTLKLQVDLQCHGVGMESLSQIPPCFLMNGPFNIRKPAWCQQPGPGRTIVFEEIQSGRSRNVDNEAFYIIGRNERSHIVLDDLMVSRCHAVLLHNGNGDSYLLDMGSSHGTFIGSSRLMPFTPTLIKKSSIVRFGSRERQFILRDYPKVDDVLEASKYLESTEEQAALLNTFRNQRNLSADKVTADNHKYDFGVSGGSTSSDDGSTDHSESSLDCTHISSYPPFSFTPDCSLGLHRRDTVDFTVEGLPSSRAATTGAIERGDMLRRSYSFDFYEGNHYVAMKCPVPDLDAHPRLGRKKVRFSEGDLTVFAEEATGVSSHQERDPCDIA